MTKAFSAWLSPAYGGGLELRPDLDQIEGLSGEREALWARLDKAAFLTADEKRAAVGYGPLPRAASDVPASFADSGPGGEVQPRPAAHPRPQPRRRSVDQRRRWPC
jgi:hypothetical protein